MARHRPSTTPASSGRQTGRRATTADSRTSRRKNEQKPQTRSSRPPPEKNRETAKIAVSRTAPRRSFVAWLTKTVTGGWKIMAAILGAVASAISVYAFVNGSGVSVNPSPMSGDLNIAVADFGVLRTNNQVSSQATAHALAQSVFDYLGTQLEPLRRDNLQVQTRFTSAVSSAQRSAGLDRIASEIRADLIVSATLTFNAGETTIIPELYLSPNKLEDALELAGYHALTPVTVDGNPDSNPVIRQDLRNSIIERARGIARFIIGLGYYEDKNRQDHLIKAAASFSLALHDWTDASGRKLLYIFLGNASGKRGQLSLAQQYYSQALKIDPTYDRAQLGLAEVLFQRAQGSCRTRTANITGLWSALAAYQKLAKSSKSAVEGLSSKVALGIGRTYLCLSQTGAIDGWAQARAQFQVVIANYSRERNSVLRELAAEGYAGVAITSIPLEGSQKGYRDAATNYALAIEYSRDPERRGFFLSALAETYMKLNDPKQACAAYHQAESVDPVHLPDYVAGTRGIPGCS
jgi:tetratricopeptide (TPR) repeat protein